MVIKFLLLQNRQGKTRLSKYYTYFQDEEKHKLESEIHRLVINRDPKFTNFLELRNFKVIYRRYAGLFFSVAADMSDNELSLLELIHLLVEVLDQYFGNVCELDLVFNFHKVFGIMDELVVGGEVIETSKQVILTLLRVQERRN
jgi:hypothetical protein